VGELTWGGLPKEEAWNWMQDGVAQKFGSIIFDLLSGDHSTRRQGYFDYYEMKRHFMEYDWKYMMANLDSMRQGLRKERMEELLDRIKKEIIAGKKKEEGSVEEKATASMPAEETAKETPRSTVAEIARPVVLSSIAPSEPVQLSLF
jgi:hypothetical protein